MDAMKKSGEELFNHRFSQIAADFFQKGRMEDFGRGILDGGLLIPQRRGGAEAFLGLSFRFPPHPFIAA